jgi:hypothetical protein
MLPATTDEDGSTPVDLVPHNLLSRPDGRLVQFDQEWTAVGATVQDITRRGILWLAIGLAQRMAPERLAPSETVGDIARRIGPMAGLDEDGHWITPAVEWEAAFQAEVQRSSDSEDSAEVVSRHRQNLLATLGTPLRRGQLGEREPELRQRAEATVVHLETVLAAAQEVAARQELAASEAAAHAGELQHRVDTLETELASVHQHPVVVVARGVSRGAAKIAPEGSLARRGYRRLMHAVRTRLRRHQA